MAYFKIFLVFITVSNTLYVNSELIMEQVIGGEPARAEDFKYHIGIIGKYNKSHARSMVCSGGILSDIFILGNAECFFETNNELMKLRFYVILGSVNLKDNIEDEQEILCIYTFTNTPINGRHYIVVLQLGIDLDLQRNTHLTKLNLPTSDITMNSTYARVAGYGMTSITQKINNKGKTRLRVTRSRDFILAAAHVDVIHAIYCKTEYPNIDFSQELCGLMRPKPEFERRGLCTYDEGAPLVIGDDVVIAVAQRTRNDCDNTIHGNVYTKVYYYTYFINGILTGFHVPETVVHLNRPQLSRNTNEFL